MPFRRENRHLTLSLISIVASLLVIGIGVMAYLAADDNKERDRADRRYAECLSEWGDDLYTALDESRDAVEAVEDARDRKDELLDELFSISASAQRYDNPDDIPPALIERSEEVVLERVKAQVEYRRLQAELEETRDENPLVAPEVACNR